MQAILKAVSALSIIGIVILVVRFVIFFVSVFVFFLDIEVADVHQNLLRVRF